MSSSVDLLDRKLAAEEADHLYVSFPAAELVLLSEDREDVRIAVQARNFEHSNKAYAAWEASHFKARTADGTMRLQTQTRPLRQSRIPGTLHVLIAIPSRIEIHVRAVGGDVRATALARDSLFEVSAGRVVLEKCTGKMSINAQASPISVEQFAGSSLNVELAGGSFSARSIETTSCSIRASTTAISLNDVRGDVQLRLSACDTRIQNCVPSPTGKLSGGTLKLSYSNGKTAQLQLPGTRLLQNV